MSKRTAVQDQWAFLDNVTKKEAKEAIKTLQKSLVLFGPKGQYWIQNDETSADENDHPTFCAIGALKEADGPGEKLAFIAVGAAMEVLEPPDNAELFQDVLDDLPYNHFESIKELNAHIEVELKARKCDIDQLSADAEENIPNFNDHKPFSAVKKAWKLAEKKLAGV